eukprot:6024223-Alexandrium_andersonii.AAC.1
MQSEPCGEDGAINYAKLIKCDMTNVAIMWAPPEHVENICVLCATQLAPVVLLEAGPESSNGRPKGPGADCTHDVAKLHGEFAHA